MTLDEIRTCIESDGWPVEPVSEVTMRSRFRGGGRVFPLFVHRDATYVTLAVIPFVRIPEEAEDPDPLYRRLLKLNREMNMAKFSVDEDGDVVLSVEYPLADLDPSEIRDAMDVLSFYADKYSAEVERLAKGVAAQA